MTKKVFISYWLLLTVGMATVVFNSYGQASNTTDRGVVINGVKWATRNVAVPGTFAAKPEDAGSFYQWNRKVSWPATGEEVSSNWDSSRQSGKAWKKSNDPSPAGWRVPTGGEFLSLLDKKKVDYERTTINGVMGGKFTDKETGNSIFLPGAGFRYGRNGELCGSSVAMGQGYYWNSETSSYGPAVTILQLLSDRAQLNNEDRAYGLSVRSVADE